MPIGTSDGGYFENEMDYFKSQNEELLKPLSQGPRIQIYPANVVKPPANVVPNMPTLRTGPEVDPTMPIDPRELPVREQMDKVQGREASLENNAPVGNLGASTASLTDLEGNVSKAMAPVVTKAILTPAVAIDSVVDSMAEGIKTAMEIVGGQHGRYEDHPQAFHEAASVLTKMGMAKGLAGFPEASLGSFGGRLKQKLIDAGQNVESHVQEVMEKATTKLESRVDRIRDRVDPNKQYREEQRAADEQIASSAERRLSWRELPPDRPTSFDPGSNVGSEYGRRPNESWSDFLGRSRQRQREITERYQRENPNWMEQQPFEHEPGGAPSQHELYGEPMSPEEHAFMERMARRAAERERYPDYQPLPSVREQGGTLPDLDILKQKHYVTPRSPGNASAYDSHIMYKLGRPVADMTVYVRPRMKNGSFVKGTKELFVSGYYGIGDNPIHKLGADNIEFFAQLRKMYPETTSFGGVRVSGARGRAGTTRYVSRDWSAFDRGKDLALVTGILSGAQTLTGDQAQANEWKKPDLMPMGGGGGPGRSGAEPVKKVDWESVGIKQVQGKAIENKLNEGKPVEAPTSFWSYILNHAVQSGNKPVIDQIINVLKTKK